MKSLRLFRILEDQIIEHLHPYIRVPFKSGQNNRKKVIDTLIALQLEIIKFLDEDVPYQLKGCIIESDDAEIYRHRIIECIQNGELT